ncbi:MAG: amidophosphoribosyltransferase [Bacillota bacterium]|nr:amidophosphoribosyltransferase [Bacillota bacterium]
MLPINKTVNNSASFITEDLEKPREKCGIFALTGYRGPGRAAMLAYLGLLALQHRGQESAGMAYGSPGRLDLLKGMGLVDRVFTSRSLSSITANTILGHVRYSTTGSSKPANAQPLLARSHDGGAIALAHNGNLTNTAYLHQKLLEEGHIFHSTSDSEIILTYIFQHRHLGLSEAVRKTVNLVKGAYAAVVTDGREVVAFRDPGGFRPLVLGRLNGASVFASETAALDTVGASFVRDINQGEIVSAVGSLLSSYSVPAADKASLCIFEYVYFARPDSVIDGVSVHLFREQVGRKLAGRIPASVDMVIPSPDSGISAGIGLADELGIPLEWAVHRNPYVGRTFIEPSRAGREVAVRLKFNPIAALVRGKRVALVDDSLVRGTTARVLIELLRAAGAAAVHLCIASPPYRFPCYYGIDIPVASDLAVPGESLSYLAASIGADSVTFARPEDLYSSAGRGAENYCTACFTGCYPDVGR